MSPFAGVVAAGGVGVIAPAIAWLIAKGDRSHQRRLAHDARLFEARRDAYIEALEDVQLRMLLVERTEPIIGPVPDPPAAPSDTDQARVRAKVAAFGSVEVLAALDAFQAAGRTFLEHVMIYRHARTQTDPTEAGEAMHESRLAVRDRLAALEGLIRQELTELKG